MKTKKILLITTVCSLILNTFALAKAENDDQEVVRAVKATSLTVEEVINLKKMILDKRQAVMLNQTLPLILTSTVVYVSTAPGSKSTVINMQKGFDVSVEIVDQNNKPWGISLISKGGDNIVSTVQAKTNKESANNMKNIVLFSPKIIGRANKLLHLESQASPISIILNVTTSPILHDRYTIMVAEENAISKEENRHEKTKFESGFISEDKELLSVLSGITPSNYEKNINTKGRDYEINTLDIYQSVDSGYIFIRTSADLLAPEPVSVITKGSFKAYKIPKSPLLLMTNNNGDDVEIFINTIN